MASDVTYFDPVQERSVEGRRADGTEHAIAHWNSTEMYARVDAGWRIVHSHWSYVKPELKQPVSEEA